MTPQETVNVKLETCAETGLLFVAPHPSDFVKTTRKKPFPISVVTVTPTGIRSSLTVAPGVVYPPWPILTAAVNAFTETEEPRTWIGKISDRDVALVVSHPVAAPFEIVCCPIPKLK